MKTQLTAALLSALTLAACGGAVADAQPGEYTAQLLTRGDSSLAVSEEAPPLRLTIERDPDRLVLRDEQGALVLTTEMTGGADDFHGCPGNFSGWDMEVLDLGVERLSVAGLELDHPILVADCGSAEEETPPLVLRDAGSPGGGSGTACDGAVQGCITFFPVGSDALGP